MALSRRAFFRSLLPESGELQQQTYVRPSQVNEDLIPIGRLPDFPVGSETEVRVNQAVFLILSSSDGIKACSKDNTESFALSMRGGLIYLSTQKRWPKNSILSTMTGEIYFLEDN